MKWNLVFVLALSISVIGCNSSKNAGSDAEAKAEVIDSDTAENLVIVSFEQTGCFGTCPVHKMVIYQDGSAFYTAERHTKLQGAFTYQFTSEETEAFLNKAKTLGFFEMQAEYTSPITDLPTSTLFFQYGARNHQVIAYSDYPENTQLLIEYLYSITQNTKWEKASLK